MVVAPPAPWVMTTDLVGVCRHGGRWGAIAVSVKFDAALSPRAQELLQIEERYWTHRGHAWRLLNCSTMPRADYHSVLAVAPSVLMFPRLAATDLEAIGSKMRAIGQQSLHAALSAIQSLHLQTATPPVSAFYQAVWSGHYPVDLGLATSRGKLRPSEHVVGEGWDPLLSEALV